MERVLQALHVTRFDLVTHDIGNMVGYALAAEHPEQVTRWVAMDAPLPGIGHWDDQLKNPKTWHFNFYGPDEERLVAGRERIYLDRFWDSSPPIRRGSTRRRAPTTRRSTPGPAPSTRPPRPSPPSRATPSTTRLPGQGQARHAGAGDRRRPLVRKRARRRAALRGQRRQRPLDRQLRHWLMEEQPDATIAAILAFLEPGH